MKIIIIIARHVFFVAISFIIAHMRARHQLGTMWMGNLRFTTDSPHSFSLRSRGTLPTRRTGRANLRRTSRAERRQRFSYKWADRVLRDCPVSLGKQALEKQSEVALWSTIGFYGFFHTLIHDEYRRCGYGAVAFSSDVLVQRFSTRGTCPLQGTFPILARGHSTLCCHEKKQSIFAIQ